MEKESTDFGKVEASVNISSQLLKSLLNYHTQCVNEVLLANQLHIFIYGFSGQCVLSEDQRFLLSKTVNLCAAQINEEFLKHNQLKHASLLFFVVFLNLVIFKL